jgi:hypothetical protein
MSFSTMTASRFAQAETLADASGGIVGWISVEPSGGSEAQGLMLSVAGRALALRELRGHYSLEVKRHSRGGVSNSRQGGAISLRPGVAAMLSQSAINIGPGDSLEIELKLYVDDREVFSASMKSQSDGVKL